MSKIYFFDVFSYESRTFESIYELEHLVNQMNAYIDRKGAMDFGTYLDYLGLGHDIPHVCKRSLGFDSSYSSEGTFVIDQLHNDTTNRLEYYVRVRTRYVKYRSVPLLTLKH